MKTLNLKRSIIRLVILLMLSAVGIYVQLDKNQSPPQRSSQVGADHNTPLEVVKQAYQNQQSNLPIQQEGRVIALLKNDVHGNRHQRFIIELASHQKLLIAHNTELAPEIENLKIDDTINFSGVYEWNNKGGVVHWTHHDPKGHHPGGWLRHHGKLYQ
jgi:Protein of unknown function (DUF3465)